MIVLFRTLPWTKVKIPGVEVKFDSRVVLGSEPEAVAMRLYPDLPQYLYFLNTSSLTFRGTDVPCSSASVTVQFIGPGSVVRFLFDIPRVGQIVHVPGMLPDREVRNRLAWSFPCWSYYWRCPCCRCCSCY